MKFPGSSSPISSNDVTIVVNSCDAYEDVRTLFFSAFKEYWADNVFPIVENYESLSCLGYSEDQKRSVTWGKRLLDVLACIESKYVILLFDDFILESKVDNKKINAAISVLDADPSSSVFYLNAASVAWHPDEPDEDYRRLKPNAEYRLNSVPAVWKKSDLMSFTGKEDNPWAWEVFGSYRTFGHAKSFYSTSSQSKNIFNYDYRKGGAIYRGKWVKSVALPKIKKYGLAIDFSVRGCCDLDEDVGRSLMWKLGFLRTGWRMVGFSVFRFILRAAIGKLKRGRL